MIIAVDFDGTLCSKAQYPNIGNANIFLIEKLKNMQEKQGAKVILYTCREGNDLLKAVQFMKQYGLIFDAVNEDVKEWNGEQRTGRKIYADIYIDDKAVNPIPFNKIPYDLLPSNWRGDK